MRYRFSFMMVALVLMSGMSRATEEATQAASSKTPVPIIFDTDMGNDVDDALALALIHSLQNRGECELLAVTITKDNEKVAPFIDLINTFYGRGEIPIGAVRDGKTQEPGKFVGQVADCKDGDSLRYPRDLNSNHDAPEATALLRKTLATAEDGSVVIVQVGFSTNLARLLESKPDEYSPLDGKELVAKKVRLLSAMAGSFSEDLAKRRYPEYNVAIDIPAAKRVFHDWPTPIWMGGFEIGRAIKYPATSILQDYDYVSHHPVAEAYELYIEMPYDRETWDLTSVLVAVRPDRGYFGLSPRGRVTVEDDGYTSFQPSETGNCRYLTVTPEQIARVREEFVHLCSEPPKR